VDAPGAAAGAAAGLSRCFGRADPLSAHAIARRPPSAALDAPPCPPPPPAPGTQAAFAASVVATISGALAERGRLCAHALVAAAWPGWVYAAAAHWAWSSEGWLSARREGGPLLGANGLIDLAGAGVAHVTAGAAALAGAYAVGPRQGRLSPGGAIQAVPSSGALPLALGALGRWVASYGIIAGAAPLLAAAGGGAAPVHVASRAAAAATIAAAAGGAAGAGLNCALAKRLDPRPMLDGVLAGLVAISAGAGAGAWGRRPWEPPVRMARATAGLTPGPPACRAHRGALFPPAAGASVVEPYAAAVIGALAAAAAMGASYLITWVGSIDDPLNAAATHLAPGTWGLFAAGLFAKPVGAGRLAFRRPALEQFAVCGADRCARARGRPSPALASAPAATPQRSPRRPHALTPTAAPIRTFWRCLATPTPRPRGRGCSTEAPAASSACRRSARPRSRCGAAAGGCFCSSRRRGCRRCAWAAPRSWQVGTARGAPCCSCWSLPAWSACHSFRSTPPDPFTPATPRVLCF
jgi:ammonia channel protein AmtB